MLWDSTNSWKAFSASCWFWKHFSCKKLSRCLYSFWIYFSTDLQKHIGHLLTRGVPLSVSYYFAFSYSSWGSQGKNTEVACHSLLQWTPFCQTSPPWPTNLGWLHRAWFGFIELDKAVVLVWLDWLVFCEYGFSVCLPCDALLQHLPSYLGFSYLGCVVSVHGCSSKAQLLLLTLDEGYLLTTAVPDLQRGIAPLGPPVPVQPLLLTLDEGYLLTAAPPDLERGVAPLSPPMPR